MGQRIKKKILTVLIVTRLRSSNRLEMGDFPSFQEYFTSPHIEKQQTTHAHTSTHALSDHNTEQLIKLHSAAMD